MDGEPLKSWNVLGHSDGMRMDPATHLLWTTSNEDGNPAFATINTVTGVVTPYTFPAPPHQGGYDDLYFLNGNAFIAASNPTLDASGLDRHPVAQRLRVTNFVGAVDARTGLITPLAVGFTKAAGMVFVPNTASTEWWLRQPRLGPVDAPRTSKPASTSFQQKSSSLARS
jgi:hypothetical protein